MADILIRGMEMPFTCLTCDFHKCAGGVGDFCSLTKRRQFRFKNRPKDCPLIEVPETHGQLIDADRLGFAMMDAANADQALAMVDDAPTIIPADA